MWVGHTALLSSILNYCSVPPEKHCEVCAVLNKLVVRGRTLYCVASGHHPYSVARSREALRPGEEVKGEKSAAVATGGEVEVTMSSAPRDSNSSLRQRHCRSMSVRR